MMIMIIIIIIMPLKIGKNETNTHTLINDSVFDDETRRTRRFFVE